MLYWPSIAIRRKPKTFFHGHLEPILSLLPCPVKPFMVFFNRTNIFSLLFLSFFLPFSSSPPSFLPSFLPSLYLQSFENLKTLSSLKLSLKHSSSCILSWLTVHQSHHSLKCHTLREAIWNTYSKVAMKTF